jgi:hypothetical protein
MAVLPFSIYKSRCLSIQNPIPFQFPNPAAFLFPPRPLDGRGVLDVVTSAR